MADAQDVCFFIIFIMPLKSEQIVVIHPFTSAHQGLDDVFALLFANSPARTTFA